MEKYVVLVACLFMFGCGGNEEWPEETMRGVQVTKIVPYSHESVEDIPELPPQGDRVIGKH